MPLPRTDPHLTSGPRPILAAGPARPASTVAPAAGSNGRWPRAAPPAGAGQGTRGPAGPARPWARIVGAACVLIVAVVPFALRDALLFKYGVVLIFFAGAIGLHLLVNWAGELSLAHGATVAVPTFAMLSISEELDVSPVYLIPVASLLGAAVGAVISLTVMRARGVQVALVTLVAGIALDRFLFTKPWLIGGPGGRSAATPTVAGLDFSDRSKLYVVLLAGVILSVVAAWSLMHSKAARAWFWIRTDADAAAAAGIPVRAYRVGAYVTAGAFGGFTGGLAAMWIQHMSPGQYQASFTYLLVVVLAGRGFLGGVLAATWLLQGAQQFAPNLFGVDTATVVDTVVTYGGPLVLVGMLSLHKDGLNGLGRRVAATSPGRRR